MTIDEMIAVLQAYKEGKTIEVGFCGEWNELKESIFDFTGKCGYRIKPEPHYRPFESADEVMKAIKEHGDWVKGISGTYCKLKWVFPSGGIGVQGKDENYTPQGMLNSYTFVDGTPFGKLVEE